MTATTRKTAPTVIDSDGVRLGGAEIGGDLTVGFVRLPQGRAPTWDRPLQAGPGDLCPCPRWGYLISGRIELRTADGVELYQAGEAFYRAPGHAPIALEDSEYVGFSPSPSSPRSLHTSRAHHDRRARRRAGHALPGSSTPATARTGPPTAR